MEEKFSVSLELMIQKFKDKAKQVQDVSKNVANKIKDNMSVDVGGGSFSKMSAESELLLNKINDIKATLQMATDDPKLLPKQDILEMRVELEKLESQYDEINGKSSKFGDTFNKIQSGMNKSLNSAKRFALSLFGIQSIYRMLSRASQSYLAQDTETSNKIQSAWIGLGSMFAPLLQTIANFTIKAVSYINVFIKALTGTDFLANAMSKSMNKANKSAGALSKTLAGFDEITNLDTSAGGASIDTSWVDSFKNVELNPKITEFFTNLGNVLRPIVDKIKEFWERLTDQQKLNVALLALGALAFAISPLIGTAIIIGVTIVGASIAIQQLKDLKKTQEDLNKMIKGVNDLLDERNKKIREDIDTGKLSEQQIKSIISSNFDFIKSNKDEIEVLKEKIGLAGSINGLTKEQKDRIAEIVRQNGFYIQSLKDLNDRGLLNKPEQERYKKVLEEQIKNYGMISLGLDENSREYETNKTKAMELKTELDKLNGKEFSAKFKLEGDTTDVNKKMNTFGDKLKQFGSSVLKLIGLPSILPKFDVGINSIPYDMPAIVHQGETIIPKGFNADEYFKNVNTNNNIDVVKKLDELIDRVENIEFSPYTTVRDVGEAGQKYRNQQSRIMGEELT